MKLVTLTTDFGSKNYNVASLKGKLLAVSDSLNIIDISHDVNNFDIEEAAYLIKNSFYAFPEGTLHIALINIYYSKNPKLILAFHAGFYFLIPDNGLLSLILDEIELKNIRVFNLENSINSVFQEIAYIVSNLDNGIEMDVHGEKTETFNQKISIKPVVSNDILRASVIYIDNFGNAVINIKKEYFYSIKADRGFKLYYNPKDFISSISRNYADVAIGDELCFFNSAGYLELAINMGNASEILGLQKKVLFRYFLNNIGLPFFLQIEMIVQGYDYRYKPKKWDSQLVSMQEIIQKSVKKICDKSHANS